MNFTQLQKSSQSMVKTCILEKIFLSVKSANLKSRYIFKSKTLLLLLLTDSLLSFSDDVTLLACHVNKNSYFLQRS